MRCDIAIETLRSVGSQRGASLRLAMDHVVDCEDCQAALRALEALRLLRDEPTPIAADAAIQRAVDRALTASPERRYRRGFWTGLASGAALAATIAMVAFGVWLGSTGSEGPAAVPQVRVALNQRSEVTVEFEAREPLLAAEVRVELRGGVELDGYAGQRELRWSTNLDRGINQLMLPVVAIDAGGGQVLVELTHGDKRRTFVLDVRAAVG